MNIIIVNDVYVNMWYDEPHCNAIHIDGDDRRIDERVKWADVIAKANSLFEYWLMLMGTFDADEAPDADKFIVFKSYILSC